MIIDKDAFSSGQIGSKLWLCEQLEQTPLASNPIDIHLYGGWYGMTAFLLLSRNNMKIKRIFNYDIDTDALENSQLLLNTWHYNNYEFYDAVNRDVNTIIFDTVPDLIINTSTEHIQSDAWYRNIPDGTPCVFQSNDMPHDDHFHSVKDDKELLELYPLSTVWYSGTLSFQYAEWGFTRSMTIGIK
jgi:hypothetical protein